MRRALGCVLGLVLVVGVLGACGDDDNDQVKLSKKDRSGKDATAASTETKQGETKKAESKAHDVDITAIDYGFDMPASFEGGLVEIYYANKGKEPHFAAMARPAPGKTIADVKAALLTPPDKAPPGPPPFEDFAGMATVDPGGTGNMTLNVPSGTYLFYCMVASPDGTPHGAKGMMKEVTVTEGASRPLPESVATITAKDFALSEPPALKAGKQVLRLRNEGKQLHELELVELAAGKKVEDLIEWAKTEQGPPPAKLLSGAAINAGNEATTEFKLDPGDRYAFVCLIPDFLGDFAPHITKGMYTKVFTVS